MDTPLNAATPPIRPTGRATRRWLWAGVFALAAVLAIAAAWAAGSALWSHMAGLGGMHSDFDITVNGQPWGGESMGHLLGWAIGAGVLALLLVLALTVVLPLALGGVVLGVLLVLGLVVGIVALPVLLVLALLLSPLLALAGLAWMLFG